VPRTTGSKDAAEPPAKKPRAPRATARKKKSAPQIRLTGDRLVVRHPENGERKTAGGLLIPATAIPAPKRLAWGDVALIGPDVRVAKEGDRVLYLPSSTLEVDLDGEEYVLLRERDIQAVSTRADETPARGSGQYL